MLLASGEARELTRDVRQPDGEAFALEGTTESHPCLGESDTGVRHLNQALDIFRRLGMKADARRVQTRLARLARF
jgi:hypothetical protein